MLDLRHGPIREQRRCSKGVRQEVSRERSDWDEAFDWPMKDFRELGTRRKSNNAFSSPPDSQAAKRLLMTGAAPPAADLAVTYWSGNRDRTFEILVNDVSIAVERQTGDDKPDFVEKRYTTPAEVLAKANERRITVRFANGEGGIGSVYDLRLLKPAESRGRGTT